MVLALLFFDAMNTSATHTPSRLAITHTRKVFCFQLKCNAITKLLICTMFKAMVDPYGKRDIVRFIYPCNSHLIYSLLLRSNIVYSNIDYSTAIQIDVISSLLVSFSSISFSSVFFSSIQFSHQSHFRQLPYFSISFPDLWKNR